MFIKHSVRSLWLVFFSHLATSAYAECQGLMQQGYDAFTRQDASLLDQLLASSDACQAEQRQRLRVWQASLLWNATLQRFQSGISADALIPDLQRIVKLAPLWQAHAALGDIYAGQANQHTESRAQSDLHFQATQQYQLALDAIKDSAITPQEPPVSIIAEIFKKAQISRLLTDQYVTTTRTRSGEPAGLASDTIRSFGVTRVALPIQFEYDSVQPAPQGQAAIADLLDYLNQQQLQQITLIGHADPSGDADYNKNLSQKRVEAIARLLKKQGFRGRIVALGRGEEEPFQVDNPQQYSQEQLYQLHRRVELRRE